SVFGFVAARLDVDLLNELVVEVLALESILDARRVDAVDEERVFCARGTVDRDRILRRVARVGVRGDTGNDLSDRGIVPARGQCLDGARGQVRPEVRRGRVYDRSLGGDDHCFLGRRTKNGVEGGVLGQADDDARLRLNGKSGQGE